MKQLFKRFTALLLAVAMLLSFAVTIGAEERPHATITVGEGAVQKDGEVTLPINIAATNAEIGSLQFRITLDENSPFTFTKADKKGCAAAFGLGALEIIDDGKTLNVTWSNADELATDMTFAKITLKANADAQTGTYALKLEQSSKGGFIFSTLDAGAETTMYFLEDTTFENGSVVVYEGDLPQIVMTQTSFAAPTLAEVDADGTKSYDLTQYVKVLTENGLQTPTNLSIDCKNKWGLVVNNQLKITPTEGTNYTLTVNADGVAETRIPITVTREKSYAIDLEWAKFTDGYTQEKEITAPKTTSTNIGISIKAKDQYGESHNSPIDGEVTYTFSAVAKADPTRPVDVTELIKRLDNQIIRVYPGFTEDVICTIDVALKTSKDGTKEHKAELKLTINVAQEKTGVEDLTLSADGQYVPEVAEEGTTAQSVTLSAPVVHYLDQNGKQMSDTIPAENVTLWYRENESATETQVTTATGALSSDGSKYEFVLQNSGSLQYMAGQYQLRAATGLAGEKATASSNWVTLRYNSILRKAEFTGAPESIDVPKTGSSETRIRINGKDGYGQFRRDIASDLKEKLTVELDGTVLTEVPSSAVSTTDAAIYYTTSTDTDDLNMQLYVTPKAAALSGEWPKTLTITVKNAENNVVGTKTITITRETPKITINFDPHFKASYPVPATNGTTEIKFDPAEAKDQYGNEYRIDEYVLKKDGGSEITSATFSTGADGKLTLTLSGNASLEEGIYRLYARISGVSDSTTSSATFRLAYANPVLTKVTLTPVEGNTELEVPGKAGNENYIEYNLTAMDQYGRKIDTIDLEKNTKGSVTVTILDGANEVAETKLKAVWQDYCSNVRVTALADAKALFGKTLTVKADVCLEGTTKTVSGTASFKLVQEAPYLDYAVFTVDGKEIKVQAGTENAYTHTIMIPAGETEKTVTVTYKAYDQYRNEIVNPGEKSSAEGGGPQLSYKPEGRTWSATARKEHVGKPASTLSVNVQGVLDARKTATIQFRAAMLEFKDGNGKDVELSDFMDTSNRIYDAKTWSEVILETGKNWTPTVKDPETNEDFEGDLIYRFNVYQGDKLIEKTEKANAGTYTIKVTFTVKGNEKYQDVPVCEGKFVIKKRGITLAMISGKLFPEKEYDGTTNYSLPEGDSLSQYVKLDGVLSRDQVELDPDGFSMNMQDLEPGNGAANLYKPLYLGMKNDAATGLKGDDAANYSLPTVTTMQVAFIRKQIKISVAAEDKVWDGTTDATPKNSDGYSNGWKWIVEPIKGETVTITASGLKFASSDASDAQSIQTSGGTFTLGGSDSSHYNLTCQYEKAKISKADFVIVPDKTGYYFYGNEIQPGVGFVYEASSKNVSVRNYGTAGQLELWKDGEKATKNLFNRYDAGNYEVKLGSGWTETNNYTYRVEEERGKIEVRPFPVSVYSDVISYTKEFDGTTKATVRDGYYRLAQNSNRPSGEDITIDASKAEANFDSNQVGKNKTVTVDLTNAFTPAANVNLSNYEFKDSKPTYTNCEIKAKTLTVTAEAKSFEFGTDLTEELKKNYTVTGAVDGYEPKLTGSMEISGTGVGQQTVSQGSLALDPNDANSKNYTLSFTDATWTITEKDLSGLTVTASTPTYNGQEQSPTLTFKDGETEIKLVAGTDYDLSGETSETNVSTTGYKLTVKFKGNYTGTKKDVAWNIGPRNIADLTVTAGTLTYDTKPHTPTLTFKDGGTEVTLTAVTDYLSDGGPKTDAGDYKVTLTGTGNYKGSTEVTWSIGQKDIGDDDVTLNWNADELHYDGTEKTPRFVFRYNNTDVTYDIVSGGTGINAGNYTLKFNGKGNYKGSRELNWWIFAKGTSDLTITLGDTLGYNGQEQSPTLTITDSAIQEGGSAKVLAEGVDYELAGDTSATNAGDYQLTIRWKGNYSGEAVTKDWHITKDSNAPIGDQTYETKYGGSGKKDLTLDAGVSAGLTAASVTASGETSSFFESVSAAYADGKIQLSWKLKDSTKAGESGTFTVTVTDSTNYENYSFLVTVKATEKTAQDLQFRTAAPGSIGYAEGTFENPVLNAVPKATYESSDPTIASVDAETGKVTIHKTGKVTITARADGNAEFEKAEQSYELNIVPSVLTVTAGSATITAGERVPGFTASVSGLRAGETTAQVFRTLTASASTDGKTAGTYAVHVSAVLNTEFESLYELRLVNGTLTVRPAASTIDTVLPIIIGGTGCSEGYANCVCDLFYDLDASRWYHEAIDWAYSLGLMNGTSRTTFSPNAAASRAQTWTMLARIAGQDTRRSTTWYEVGRTWAMAQGITDGTNPMGTLTREQLAAMLYRYAGSPAVSGTLRFTDSADVSAWAKDAMIWAVQNGILDGVGGNRLNPKGNTTRAQAAAIFMRFWKLSNQ